MSVISVVMMGHVVACSATLSGSTRVAVVVGLLTMGANGACLTLEHGRLVKASMLEGETRRCFGACM
jgi:hypothetical protein